MDAKGGREREREGERERRVKGRGQSFLMVASFGIGFPDQSFTMTDVGILQYFCAIKISRKRKAWDKLRMVVICRRNFVPVC